MSAGTAPAQALRERPRVVSGARTRALSPYPLAVLALCGLAAALRLYRLGHQGFWFDEANTSLLVHLSPGKMIGLIPQTESTPPLYYCLAWVWARVFGYGESALRSLSALGGVLVVPVAYGAAAKLVSMRAGVIAAALCASNPLLIWYSQEARSYELLVLLSGCSLLAFAYLLDPAHQTWRTAAAWVIASALALATHYYALLVVVPEALWLLIAHRRSRTVLTAVGLTAVCGLALIPLALSQNGTGRANWIHHAPPGRRVGQIVPQFVFGFASPAYSVLEPVAIALAAFGVILLLARGGGSVRRGALLAGSIALAGFVINLLLVAAGIDNLLTRNLLALWLPAAVAVAGGFALARWRVVGGAAAGLLCALGVAAAIGVARDRNVQRPDWRGVARVLGPRPLAGAGGRVIFVQHYRDLLPLSLYLPHLRFMRTSAVRVSELDVVSFASPPSSGFCWWGSACNLWPSRPQASYAVPGFRVLWRRHAYQFTVLRMVADRGGALVTPSLVSRALTTTRYANDELLIQR